MPIVAGGFAVASVNYRLVPSVRYPAPVHDAKAAVRWLRAKATEYGLDPDRIAIGGVSAGGHLASLTALTAGYAQLEGDLGDHLGVSSAVSAVVAYCPAATFSFPGAHPARDPDPPASVERGAARTRPDRRRPRACAIGQPASLRPRRRAAAPDPARRSRCDGQPRAEPRAARGAVGCRGAAASRVPVSHESTPATRPGQCAR
jgi:acetyl esterase/lipase